MPIHLYIYVEPLSVFVYIKNAPRTVAILAEALKVLAKPSK